MKFNRVTLQKNEAVNDREEKATNKFVFKRNEPPLVVKKEESEVLKNEIVETPEEDAPEFKESMRITDKLVCKGQELSSLLEMSRSALSLRGHDKNGYATSMDGKMYFVFATFKNSNFSQVDKIPIYIDVSKWLGLCKKFSDGELFELAERSITEQNSSGAKYAKDIWSDNGGSFAPIYLVNKKTELVPKGTPIACITRLSPAKKANTFMLSAEIWPGKLDDTGRYQIKPGARMIKKIQIPIPYEKMEEWMEMSKVIIQSYYNKVLMNE